jgi:hypothetical protein
VFIFYQDTDYSVNNTLVGDEVIGWNSFLKSLIDLGEKLEEVGLVYVDSQVIYIEEANRE